MFTDSIFRKKDFAQGLATVSVPTVTDKKVTVAYESPSAVAKAQIHWTTDLGKPWPERQWQSADGQVLGLGAVEGGIAGRQAPRVLCHPDGHTRGGHESGSMLS